jgi:hypothetical protein
MHPKSPVTSSVREIKLPLTNAERRAADVVIAAGRQVDLKREAAERRAARELLEAETPARNKG